MASWPGNGFGEQLTGLLNWCLGLDGEVTLKSLNCTEGPARATSTLVLHWHDNGALLTPILPVWECPANEHMSLPLPTKHDLLAAFGHSGEFLTKTWLALRCLINSKLCLKMALRLGGSVCDSNESDQRLHLDGKGNDTT